MSIVKRSDAMQIADDDDDGDVFCCAQGPETTGGFRGVLRRMNREVAM